MYSLRSAYGRWPAMLSLTALAILPLATGCGKKESDDAAQAPATTAPVTTTSPTPPGPSGTMMTQPSQNPNGAPGDALITAKVKSALIADKRVGATHINVDTKSDTVVLRGTVASKAAMKAAEEDAAKMEGVTKVINQLTVSAK